MKYNRRSILKKGAGVAVGTVATVGLSNTGAAANGCDPWFTADELDLYTSAEPIDVRYELDASYVYPCGSYDSSRDSSEGYFETTVFPDERQGWLLNPNGRTDRTLTLDSQGSTDFAFNVVDYAEYDLDEYKGATEFEIEVTEGSSVTVHHTTSNCNGGTTNTQTVDSGETRTLCVDAKPTSVQFQDLSSSNTVIYRDLSEPCSLVTLPCE
ncbi:hypothetical protein [Natrinema altunense]|uniref:hypothetical protein n=1 Tax=Natrinema altunense TaxID=222984 RepID=UPI001F5C4E70|nr:hypothetical protein [Natrinema altunense]